MSVSIDCPTGPTGKHTFAGNFATVTQRAAFEPVSFGETAEDTLYRRVEYVITTCGCGQSWKRKVNIDHEQVV